MTVQTITRFKHSPIKILCPDHHSGMGVGNVASVFVVLCETGQGINNLHCYDAYGGERWTTVLSDFHVASTSEPWMYTSSTALVFHELPNYRQESQSVVVSLDDGAVLRRGQHEGTGNVTTVEEKLEDGLVSLQGIVESTHESVRFWPAEDAGGGAEPTFSHATNAPYDSGVVTTAGAAGNGGRSVVLAMCLEGSALEVVCFDPDTGVARWTCTIGPEQEWMMAASGKDSPLLVHARFVGSYVHIKVSGTAGDRLSVLDSQTGDVVCTARSPRRS